MSHDAAADLGMIVKLWGCGGSVPVGRAGRGVHGGDTTCFEFRRHPTAVPLIVDLGSGARDLGAVLKAEANATGRPVRAEVLLSHFHLDHVIGLPFFAPLYDPEAEVLLRSGLLPDGATLAATLAPLATAPLFPVHPLEMGAAKFSACTQGEPFEAAGFTVTALPVNHPGGAHGFRIEAPEGCVCVIGDHEHGDPAIDAALVTSVQGADLMIYDATYDDEDYERHRGWGHSTWRAGLALAEAAGVGRVLFHHHPPEMNDDALARRDAAIQAASPRAALARQGMRMRVANGAVTDF